MTPNEILADRRRELYEALQMTLAGYEVKACLEALSDSLASTVAFAAGTEAEATELLDKLVPDIKKTMRENWAYVREVKVHAGVPGRAPENH